MKSLGSAIAGAILAASTLWPAHAGGAACQDLSGKTLGGALIFETNDIKPPFVVTSTATPPEVVTVTAPFCRARGVIRPVKDSVIYFEVWLPPAQAWNGSYLGNSAGGFGGSMFYGPAERGLLAGYAASTNDYGHIGSDVNEWAVGAAQKVDDFGWRAVHETAVASKAVIAAYYGAAPKKSYFIGCSKGGGSALMAAQRFPTDFDGIVASSPGLDISGQAAKYLWTAQVPRAPGAWISPAKLARLNAAVLAACGGANGILDDPGSCRFDPARIQCKGADTDTCLTAEEVASARKVYSGPMDERGVAFYAGNARGSELAWSNAVMGPRDRPGSVNRFPQLAGFVFDASGMDLLTLRAHEIYTQFQQKVGRSLDAVDANLDAFKAAGGKLLVYHGWNDTAVPPDSSTKYFDKVAANVGGVDKAQGFFRLFMSPGVGHCGGGLGPSAVGGAINQPPPVRDAEHDVIAALARWVEQGAAPEMLIATRYENDAATGRIAAQRPWCPYPAAARYRGSGDRNLASSWACAVPGGRR